MKFPLAQTENTVYFRVIDHDDESPYETDILEPDNYEAVGINGVGLHTSSAVLGAGESFLAVNINSSQGFKTATCYLQVTDRYSGDNYKVEASLDPGFPSGSTVETSNLVAWKRAYVELRKSYQNGGFLSRGDDLDQDNMIELFNNSDFEIGDEIVIFDNNPLTADIETRVIGKSGEHLLEVEVPILINLSGYSGIRIKNDERIISVPVIEEGKGLSELTNIKLRVQDAFGYNGNGNDTNFDNDLNNLGQGDYNAPSGGVFTEFRLFYGSPVPTWKGNFSILWGRDNEYMDFWQTNVSPSYYTFYLVNWDENNPDSGTGGGLTYTSKNNSMVFVVPPPLSTIPISADVGHSILNTIVHELGHCVNAPASGNAQNHTDTNFHFDNLISNDTANKCIMTYANIGDPATQEGNHQYRNSAEFDSHHNHLGGDSGTGTGDSCIEDIREFAWPDEWQ